ncbi:MAG TPA: KUP/HAK/KT family potassium transporter, partial [Pontibacter sp.]
MSNHAKASTVSTAGVLISLGIIYGDIGTSPLYVMKAILGDDPISQILVYGGISCVFWTLTLQTTIKYVLLTLQADNNGEGGIFSLYTLIRRRAPWLIVPAMIGGAALLADGIITPPISVSSAIEGLRILNPDIPTVPIVLTILTIIFLMQSFGTEIVGKAFGPIMLVWFSMLGVLGALSLVEHPEIIHALNPYYAYNLLVNYPDGFWVLGAVFLCTTGAEALYSDLGHCGRPNIRLSWGFVKTCLLLNYLG